MNGTLINGGGDAIFAKVVSGIFNPLYQLLVVIAFIYFLYGVAKFIYDMNDPEKKTFGKSHLLWGLVGLFIILSIGGILQIFNNIFGGMFTY